jgi:hypothetical protein
VTSPGDTCAGGRLLRVSDQVDFDAGLLDAGNEGDRLRHQPVRIAQVTPTGECARVLHALEDPATLVVGCRGDGVASHALSVSPLKAQPPPEGCESALRCDCGGPAYGWTPTSTGPYVRRCWMRRLRAHNNYREFLLARQAEQASS